MLPVILGGDHTIALPDVTGVARHVGWGRVSVIHFDAHADTGDTQFGSLYGHGTPMRRLIESGACRGDRFLQIGLRGYWPEPETLDWMAAQGMRSFEMSEIVARGLDDVLGEALAIAATTATASSSRSTSTSSTPARRRAPARPSRAGSPARQLLDAVRRIAMEVPLGGHGRRRGLARPTTTPRSPPTWPTASCSRRSAASPGDAASTRRADANPVGPAAEGPLVAHRFEDAPRRVSSVVSGCRKASRATVSPSHLVGVTKATWSRSSWWLHCV